MINCVLEDRLPPHLKELDFSLTSEETPAPLPETRVKDGPHHADSLVDKRESVYDGDEFDVFRRPDLVDLSHIHVGEKYANKLNLSGYEPFLEIMFRCTDYCCSLYIID